MPLAGSTSPSSPAGRRLARLVALTVLSGAVSLQLGGDWAGYPILEVRPSGSTVRSDATGQYVVSALRIPPGEKRVVDIVTIPQTPGESAFTFSVRELTDVGE